MDAKYNTIELHKSKLSTETANIAKEIITEINLYLSAFSKFSTFSFASLDYQKCESDYMNFMIKISPKVSKLTALTSELASLIISADREKMIETTLLLQKRFDAFCLFEKSLYEYTEKMDASFSSKNISASFIISVTQKFKVSVDFLHNENL